MGKEGIILYCKILAIIILKGYYAAFSIRVTPNFFILNRIPFPKCFNLSSPLNPLTTKKGKQFEYIVLSIKTTLIVNKQFNGLLNTLNHRDYIG